MTTPRFSYLKIRYWIALIVAVAAGSVTNGVIRNNVALGNPLQRVLLTIGAFAISGIVSDRARRWAEKECDSYREIYLTIMNEVANA